MSFYFTTSFTIHFFLITFHYQVTPLSVTYTRGTEFEVLEDSPSGTIANVSISVIDNVTSVCLDSAFAMLQAGSVALVPISNLCDYSTVVKNAQNNGAVAVLLRNSIDEAGPVSGELGDPTITIPVLGISYLLGDDLSSALNPTVSITVVGDEEISYTSNLFADTVGTNTDSIIIIGSHLDSVPAGPGINDNGSGSAVNLELAIQFHKFALATSSTVRFAWWGAEELGLLGSTYYVENLSPAGKYINFIFPNITFLFYYFL